MLELVVEGLLNQMRTTLGELPVSERLPIIYKYIDDNARPSLTLFKLLHNHQMKRWFKISFFFFEKNRGRKSIGNGKEANTHTLYGKCRQRDVTYLLQGKRRGAPVDSTAITDIPSACLRMCVGDYTTERLYSDGTMRENAPMCGCRDHPFDMESQSDL